MNIVFAVMLAGNVLGGSNVMLPGDDSLALTAELQQIFREIEHGILSEDARGISKHFGKQVFLGLQNTESAYYSSNQALLSIQNYFSSHHIVSFKLSSINAVQPSPYATGGGT